MSKFILHMAWLQCAFVIVALSRNGYAQNLSEVVIANEWQQQKLEKAFADIQQQTNYFFSYDSEQIKYVTITGNSERITLLNLLKYISVQTGLRFSVVDDLILVIYDKDATRLAKLQNLKGAIELPPNNSSEWEAVQEATIFEVVEIKAISDHIIKGKVINPSGEPLIGASIQVKETGQGTTADDNGHFTITIPTNQNVTLIASYVGYEGRELAIDGQNNFTIVLENHISQLNEVVVMGYGTGTKEKFNGAASNVDGAQLEKYATANFEQGLVGNLAGIQISFNGKNPGDNSVIQIRGLKTLTAGTNPLIVIDGNPLSEGSSFSSMNIQDIAAVSVLKDAASAAIYGSRASNGVILITTKKGQPGQLEVTYDGYTGFQQRIDNFQLADAYSTAKFDYDARNYGYLSGGTGRSITDDNDIRDAKGGGKRSRIQPFLQDYLNGTQGLTNTNWADEVFRIAPLQNHYLNLSGGTAQTDYTISFGYFNQDNIVIASDYERYTNYLQLNTKVNDRLKFGITSNVAIVNAHPTGERSWSDFNLNIGGQPDPAQAIYLMFPYYSIYDADGSLAVATQLHDNNDNWDGPISGNTVAAAKLTDHEERLFRLFGNTYAEINPMKDLTFKTSFGGDFNTGAEAFFAPSTLGNYRTPVEDSRTMAFQSNTKRQNYISENLLTYNKVSEDHSINAIVGYSYQQETRENIRLESEDFPDDNLRNISGATFITSTTNSSKWALESIFSRLQYQFDNKYAASASFRRDGSSRFGAATKYGNFASVSAGWTLSNEAFFPKNDIVSFAKARASWGQTGNNQIGNYASVALIAQDNYVFDDNLTAGAYTRTAPNTDLSWETNVSFNFGLDVGLWDNQLLITAEYYTSNTTDLLLNVPVPQQSGFTESLQNIGELANSGFELEIKGSGFRWAGMRIDFNINFTTNNNQVIALGGGQSKIVANNGGMGFITEVGESVAQFYAYDIIGVYRTQEELDSDPIRPLTGTEVGDYIVRDVNGDGNITPDDRTSLGDYNPDFTYGFDIILNYKGFDFAVQFNGVEGRKAADRMIYYTESGEGFFVPSQYYVDNYYNEDNPDGFFRRPDFSSFSSAGRLTRASSLSVLDADYFRLRYLQVGYTLSRTFTRQLGIQQLRIYMTGNNIFNVSSFRGYNPDGIDTRSNTTQTLTRGWIQSASPLTRFVAFGMNVKF